MNSDFYSILEVSPTSATEEIKKNYFRLAKLYHPDVAGDLPENREKFKRINEAYSVLSNPQNRHQYDESLRNSKRPTRDVRILKENDQKSASTAFRQAKDAMRDGHYDKAVLILKSTMRLSPDNPTYLSWYGFCLAMTGANLHEARDACRKAVEIEFYNPEYHANLGFVYFKAGLKNQAVKYFQDALKWDPHNAIASKFMAQLECGAPKETGPIDKVVSGLKSMFSRTA